MSQGLTHQHFADPEFGGGQGVGEGPRAAVLQPAVDGDGQREPGEGAEDEAGADEHFGGAGRESVPGQVGPPPDLLRHSQREARRRRQPPHERVRLQGQV